MASSVLLSVSLIVSVIALSVLSSNRCCAFQRGVSYETITVVNAFPHDPRAFTEGLLYHGNDTLFESTGLYGESSVREVSLRTGKVENIRKMDGSLFGEGLALLRNRLFQLTWSQKDGFIYDPKKLSKIGTFNHDMRDGWGLTTDGKVLFGSDGSSTLYQFEPQTSKAVSKQVVYYKGHQVHNLNELEYINGEVWANVLPTDCIVRISPNDGSVLGWILLQNLRKELVEAGEISDHDVMNGIAWDAEQNRIFGVREHLEIAGFMGLAEIPFFTYDGQMISTLVERWRPETHTFHMPIGEMTITLQDVAMITALFGH